MKALLGAIALGLVSCANTEKLEVRQFHLRKERVSRGNEYVRAEMNKRLYGAVTAEERAARKGQYYTVKWNELTGEESVKVVMEYRQALTGSKVKKISRKFPAARSGKTEFQIIGPAYLKKGRVLSWKISLYEGSEKIADKKSYLWD